MTQTEPFTSGLNWWAGDSPARLATVLLDLSASVRSAMKRFRTSQRIFDRVRR